MISDQPAALRSERRPRQLARQSGSHDVDNDWSINEYKWKFLWFILIGLAAGWLAGQLTKGGGFGLAGNLIIGVIGAVLGGFLFTLVGFQAGGLVAQLIVATVGAILLLFLLGFLKKK